MFVPIPNDIIVQDQDELFDAYTLPRSDLLALFVPNDDILPLFCPDISDKT